MNRRRFLKGTGLALAALPFMGIGTLAAQDKWSIPCIISGEKYEFTGIADDVIRALASPNRVLAREGLVELNPTLADIEHRGGKDATLTVYGPNAEKLGELYQGEAGQVFQNEFMPYPVLFVYTLDGHYFRQSEASNFWPYVNHETDIVWGDV